MNQLQQHVKDSTVGGQPATKLNQHKISIVVAGCLALSAENNPCNYFIIGKKGSHDLLWHLKPDLKHFAELTKHKTVVLGRNTYESILAAASPVKPKGKLLRSRNHVILSRNLLNGVKQEVLNETVEGIGSTVSVIPSLATLNRFHNEDLFIIGGAEIYQSFLPYATEVHLTRIEHQFVDGGKYATFPHLPAESWELSNTVFSRGPFSVDTGRGKTEKLVDYAFQTYTNKNPQPLPFDEEDSSAYIH